MLEGLWSVEVLSSDRGVNVGVLVFQPQRRFGDFYETGRILGGDRSYVFEGRYAVENRAVNGEVWIVHYADDTQAVFGPDRRFRIRIAGELDRHVDRDVLQFTAERVDAERRWSLRLVRRKSPT